jgi:hypothetical protein
VLLGKPAAPLIVFELANEGVPVLQAEPGGLARHEVGQCSISEGLSSKERAPILAKPITRLPSVESSRTNLISSVLAVVDKFLLNKPHTMAQGCHHGQPFIVHPTFWNRQSVLQQLGADHGGRASDEISAQERC